MNYKNELDKVMSPVMPFTYRGVICTPIVGGFEVLGKKVKTLEELEKVISDSCEIIKSTIVGS